MIEVLYNLGDDALGNFFQVTIPHINLASGDLDMSNIIFRTTTVDIPESGANSYMINYKTQEMPKVGGKVALTKTFSMTMRIDRYYSEYSKILQWKNAVANPYTGVIGSDAIGTTPNRVDITVQPIDRNGDVSSDLAVYWIFHYAYIKTVPNITFDYGAGEPITVALTFEYATLEEVGLD